ncbi:hypothetical protein DUNSADRAFT_7813 [Dunaliella salina]|uniref:Encoded protein n=1 Tax=Dunaliella salina TaxID=3046 RepID=A0ABQ7FTX3_DUNSA|nr:hypothetical protein DUNSADRAFT_7813 [Dunaliella salina]|eukprot:KAF5825653.1 hypothetical protein DUNSADRAFT_7813 [Dunaliella salina]
MANPEFAKALAARFAVVHTRPSKALQARRFKTLSSACSLLSGMLLAVAFFRTGIVNVLSQTSNSGETSQVAEPSSAIETSDFKDVGRLLTSGRPLVLPAAPNNAQGVMQANLLRLCSRLLSFASRQGIHRLCQVHLACQK